MFFQLLKNNNLCWRTLEVFHFLSHIYNLNKIWSIWCSFIFGYSFGSTSLPEGIGNALNSNLAPCNCNCHYLKLSVFAYRATDNLSKNRYSDVQCLDHTRVVLSAVPGNHQSSSYINANHVDGYKQKSAYIATQGGFRYYNHMYCF